METAKQYTQDEFPDKHPKADWASVDVFMIDKNGVLNTGFYSFRESKWHFHSGIPSDYYEGQEPQRFNWVYKPEYLKEPEI